MNLTEKDVSSIILMFVTEADHPPSMRAAAAVEFLNDNYALHDNQPGTDRNGWMEDQIIEKIRFNEDMQLVADSAAECFCNRFTFK